MLYVACLLLISTHLVLKESRQSSAAPQELMQSVSQKVAGNESVSEKVAGNEPVSQKVAGNGNLVESVTDVQWVQIGGGG